MITMKMTITMTRTTTMMMLLMMKKKIMMMMMMMMMMMTIRQASRTTCPGLEGSISHPCKPQTLPESNLRTSGIS